MENEYFIFFKVRLHLISLRFNSLLLITIFIFKKIEVRNMIFKFVEKIEFSIGQKIFL
jgi:hypothetical protein